MPFNNPIVGGKYLVIPEIDSQNYVPGVSGWHISRDGNAEFNAGTFRGSIEVGPLTGQHYIVNNTATGDVVDIYDSSNRLVGKIDNVGGFWTIAQPSEDSTVQFGEGLSFQNLASAPQDGAAIIAISDASSSGMTIFSGASTATAAQSSITLRDSVSNGGLSNIQLSQRAPTGGGPGIGGTIVTTDTNNTNSQIHGDVYSATVVGASGMATFNHGCLFTPKGGVAGPLKHFSQWNWNDAFGGNGTGFNASQAQITMYQPNGTALTNGSPGLFYAWFWG